MTTQAQLEARMATERAIIQHLLATARAAGWEVRYVNDGEERVRCISDEQAMAAVFSVDESFIFFRKTLDGVPCGQTVLVVLGNDGWDVIADHSTNPVFEAEVMDPTDKFAETFEPV